MKKLTKFLCFLLVLVLSTAFIACDNGANLAPLDKEVSQEVDGNKVYDVLTQRVEPKLSYSDKKSYKIWRRKVKSQFIKSFGIDEIKKNACPLDVKIMSSEEIQENEFMPAHTRIYFVFNSEYGATVPCYLLVPKTQKDSYPLAITLQGHNEQGHLSSIGSYKDGSSEGTIEYALNRGAFAIQALEQGYIALTIEQRGMGSLKPTLPHQLGGDDCGYTAHKSIMLGRTINGERVWDVSKAIDALSDNVIKNAVPNIDLSDITITGNSGGGTTSYYAACYDERITTCVPSCAFSSWEYSLLYSRHCSCNFVPDAYTYFDMQDMACLIAPRKLIVVSGVTDTIFPLGGVESAFETVKAIYKKAGAQDNCKLEVTGEGHYWCEDVVWQAISSMR